MRRFCAGLEDPGLTGLAYNVVAVWLALFSSLILLAATGNSMGAQTSPAPRGAPWTPPGPFIAGTWMLLYTMMALSMWRLNVVSHRASLKWTVLALFAFCLLWPFYGFDNVTRWPSFLGNVGIFVLAIFAVWRLWPHSRTGALLIAPTVLWISIATASILDGARRYGW